jgi:hypothetical protein
VLGERVESRVGERLVVRGSDSAEVNRLLVAGGVAVHELVEQRHTLEEVILRHTSAGSDRVPAEPVATS